MNKKQNKNELNFVIWIEIFLFISLMYKLKALIKEMCIK